MRAATVMAVACAAACAVGALLSAPGTAVAAAAGERPRAAIVFVPGPAPEADPPMIERLAAFEALRLGFTSSIMGSYSPEQTLLDISAGSRTWTSLYDTDLRTPMALERRDGWVMSGWAIARMRADTAPADIVPGTLAAALPGTGGSVAYVGMEGRVNREAIVAADRSGRVARATLRPRAAVGREAVRAWRQAQLLVARLPSGEDGRLALAALLAARAERDLVLAVQGPTGVARRLLAIGAVGLGGEGRNVRSDSTRTDGIVVSTDLAPTVLEHLGVDVPDDVSGEPIESAGDRSADDLDALRERLADVGPRRWSVVLLGLLGAVLLAAAGTRAADGFRRACLRGGLLAALWLPAVLLLTGAIAPSPAGEVAIAAGLAGVLAIVSARLAPWPFAVAVAGGVTVLAHVADLAFGSELTARSLFGPNPILGARFYGVGNELEVTLAAAGLLALGAALWRAQPRPLARGFVVGGAALALVLSSGRLGADVGAVVMLTAGTAAAALTALGGRFGPRRLALVLMLPVLALALLASIDLVTGGDAHFTRSVLRAGGLDELADVAQRRLELSYHSLRRGVIWLLVAIAVAALAWGVAHRRALLEPLAGAPGVRAGLVGVFAAVVVGSLANDSGPIILLIGSSYLALAAGYFQVTAKQPRREAPAAITPREGRQPHW